MSRYDNHSTGDFVTDHIVVLPPLAMFCQARQQTIHYDVKPPVLHWIPLPICCGSQGKRAVRSLLWDGHLLHKKSKCIQISWSVASTISPWLLWTYHTSVFPMLSWRYLSHSHVLISRSSCLYLVHGDLNSYDNKHQYVWFETWWVHWWYVQVRLHYRRQ